MLYVKLLMQPQLKFQLILIYNKAAMELKKFHPRTIPAKFGLSWFQKRFKLCLIYIIGINRLERNKKFTDENKEPGKQVFNQA